MIGMKRAQTDEFLAPFMKGQVLGNDFYNIACLLNATYGAMIKANWHSRSVLSLTYKLGTLLRHP
jgi:hypothetical protein